MEQIVIRGGRPLMGSVQVSGAKNAALPILAACLMVRGTVRLRRVPRLADVTTMVHILRLLGVSVDWIGENDVLLTAQHDGPTVAPVELVRQMRGSVCVLGPLVATRGEATVPMPGGCVLGPRPIDLHVKGLRGLGALVQDENEYVYAYADRLRGSRVRLAGPHGSTVLGTANVVMAATLAEGRTVIEHAAREPEVQDLCSFLNARGARIQGIGTRTLTVDGVRELTGGEHTLIGDRIEAGTLLLAGAVTGGCVRVRGINPNHLDCVLEVMHQAGAETEASGTAVLGRIGTTLRPARFATATYPGVPTDMQPQLTTMLCCAPGRSTVGEGVYPDRFTHVPELQRMGAKIVVDGACAHIDGGHPLKGADVAAADLRAGASLVLAGLAASGTTAISGVDQINRGYERLEEKLRSIGADVERRIEGAARVGERKSA